MEVHPNEVPTLVRQVFDSIAGNRDPQVIAAGIVQFRLAANTEYQRIIASVVWRLRSSGMTARQVSDLLHISPRQVAYLADAHQSQEGLPDLVRYPPIHAKQFELQ